MNKIYKVIYSKVKQCYIVVSELAKSHVKSSHGSNGQQKAALTMSVLLALGAFTFAFGPANAEAAAEDPKPRTEGQQFIGVYHDNSEENAKNSENYQAGIDSKNQGAKQKGAITIGVHTTAGENTIAIGNRLAETAHDSVFIGAKYDANATVDKATKFKVVSIGAESDASGTGSIALGYGATADISNVSGEGKNPDGSSHSIAIGYLASAKQNNIAIGANSVATDTASTTAAKYTDQAAVKSYVSVGDGKDGSDTKLRRITNVADGAADTDVATIAQLNKVAAEKGTWKLTANGDSTTSSTVDATNNTVDFSAGSDGNLSISKNKNSNNVTIGLKKDVTLGNATAGNGGSLDVYRAVGDASSDKETNEHNQSYDQLGSHVRIDGSTVSVHYDNGTDSDARGAVLGIANDSYKDTNDATKTVSSPLGYVYLQDGKNYYYLHGAMHGDTNYQGRLAYDSSESGYNYIANLDDGIKFSGDTKKDEKAVTVDTKLDSNAANNTLSITGGADVSDTTKLTNGNIGVIATANETNSETGEVTKAGGLSIQLAKDLKGITSISNQKTTKDSNNKDVTTGTKIELGDKDITISGGNVNVSNNQITNVKSALEGAKDANGNATSDIAAAAGDSLTNVVNLKDLQNAYNKLDTKVNNNKTKYYSVNETYNGQKISGDEAKTVFGDYAKYLNENNDGAKAFAGTAAGYMTYTSGIASTVGGSFSGITNEALQSGSIDFRGAAALSYGTFNINDNTSASQPFSGVANSIVGQANMTTDSNAAIIVGAGNSVTNSYRAIDATNAGAILQNLKDPTKLNETLKAAVPNSGAQVMVMGGGNSADNAYMTQIVGVGNTVKGTNTNKDKKTASEYDESASTQYNYVDGFQNTLTNGKNDYIIGSNNTITGSSVDTNKSNLVLGDNHKLTDKKNNVILGSADDKDTVTDASEAVIIGHNANVSVDGGVALGNGSVSVATADADAEGYDPTSTATNKASSVDSSTWKATTGAVSIGGVNGDKQTTRRITNLAAGFNDTDAVNVAQIKKLANIDASNIGANLKGPDGQTKASDDEIRTNENNWGKAIGNGVIADPTKSDTNDPEKNGSQQLVTGGTVYKALNGGLTKVVIGTPGKDGKDGEDGKPGTIGLVGPAGTNGKDGSVDITIQKGTDKAGEDGKDGIKGEKGVDGKDGINRIVYEDKNGQHQTATMEDGLKFAGDDGQTDATKVIAKKLNNTIDIIGGADSTKLTDKNIGVNSVTENGTSKLKIQLAKDLTGITSIGNQTTTGEGKDATTTGAKITLDEKDKNISVNGGSIKDVASNLTKDGKLIDGSANNAASISDVQTLVQQGVDNGYTNGDGITIQKDGTSGKNVISVKKGDGLKFNDNKELVVNTGDGLEIDSKTNAVKIKTSDSNFKVDANGIGLSDKITIGTTKPVTIDGTTGEVSGLTNTKWDSKANDYSTFTKAATESQVAAAVEDAVKQAGTNDTHVAAGSYEVNDKNQVSMNLVGNNNKNKGTITIIDVAKASEVGDISKLADGVKNTDKDGKTMTTTVVEAINNVNTKIGDQKYYTGEDTGHTVKNGDSITSAIGKLDGAVQQAASAAGKHSTVSEGSNIKVDGNVQTDGHTDYKVSLKDDITLKKVTSDTLTVNNSATIGGVTIENKTISGLADATIEKGSDKAVNAGTIYNELRPSSGTYINQNNTTAKNLTNLDTQVKKTSDLINSDGKTIKIGSSDTATKVDVSGKDGQGRVITGVKTDTKDATSAASVGYVNDMNAANTQQIYHDMNSAYSHVENDISRAAAGSNALAALHPMEFDPDDKAQYALGYGHYRNSNAGAVGVFYQPDENSMFSLGASFGNGDAGINAGVTVKFGPGGSGHHALTKTQMAKVINEQSQEIDTLKKDNADKDKRIDALEQKVNEILAKVEKDKA